MTHLPRSTRNSAGFTLIELLIGLVISGILAGFILQVITGQARFTDIQYARQEVTDNTRSALELAASELRAAPVGDPAQGGGIIHASSDSIQFRAPLAWGVYCGTTGGTAYVNFDKRVWDNGSAGIPATVGLALQLTPTDPTSAAAPTFATMDAVTNRGVAVNVNDCSTVNKDAATVAVAFDGAAIPGGGPGVTAYVYRTVAYGDGVPGDERWMSRGIAAAREPLAGPVESIQFRYLDAGNVDITSSVAARMADIRRVRLIVRMKAQRGSGAQSHTFVSSHDSVTITLRNVR